MKKLLLIINISVISCVSANTMSPEQLKLEYLKSESGAILLKKGSIFIQNNDGSFKLKNGCYTKYDNSKQKTIESCVHNKI